MLNVRFDVESMPDSNGHRVGLLDHFSWLNIENELFHGHDVRQQDSQGSTSELEERYNVD